MLIFKLPGGVQYLIFTDAVLSFISRYRQIHRGQSESGGQLFAKVTPKVIVVAAASGPHRIDRRSRFLFIPNKNRLEAEIRTYFSKGLHYVGDWHTHPQKFPKPSCLDIASMKKCFRLSRHELEYFLLVVIGEENGPEGIWVGLINHSEKIVLFTH